MVNQQNKSLMNYTLSIVGNIIYNRCVQFELKSLAQSNTTNRRLQKIKIVELICNARHRWIIRERSWYTKNKNRRIRIPNVK